MDKLRYKHNADVKPMQTGRRLGCSAWSGILRCDYRHERRGSWFSVGFLVSGGAEHRDHGAEAHDGDAAGSAAGAGADLRRESVCAAGFVPASGNAAFIRPVGWPGGGVLLPRMAI